jgi:tripartite-type tricarboxylate transporter receptor subunit TctC
MSIRRRRFLHLAAGAVAFPAVVRTAWAQAYPTRPIRLLVPFLPGGSFDAIGRPWADKMKAVLGTVIVENQGGAGGSLAAATVAHARPDGYTILLGASSIHLIELILKSRPLYDPIKDLQPVTMLAINAFAIAVHPAVPARTVKELIDYARANPGKVSYGTTGVGSLQHLTGELLKSLTGGPDIVHVPYRGAGPATADLLAGQVPMVILSMTGQILESHRSGKLRVLAVTSPGRFSAAPEIPTAVEAGFPDVVAQQAIGLFVPTGTPMPIVARISGATRTVVAEKAYQKMLIDGAFEPQFDWTPERFRRFLDDDIARWTPVAKAIGIKLD